MSPDFLSHVLALHCVLEEVLEVAIAHGLSAADDFEIEVTRILDTSFWSISIRDRN